MVTTAIDENTKLSDLTDYDIADLTQQIKAKDAASKPLIGSKESITALVAEYDGAPAYLKNIQSLRTRSGWNQIRRTRGDGDCFYRSFAFAYVERLLASNSTANGDQDRVQSARASVERLESLMPLLDQVGFARDIVDDFYHPFRDLILARPSPDALLTAFVDPEVSNSIVVFLRLLTSAFLAANADEFAPFLFGLEEDDPRSFEGGVPTMDQFRSFHVEAVNKEADHIQITALTRALGVHTTVAYLDRSSSENGLVSFIEFESESKDKLHCALLYRPGHYELIYQ